MSTALKSVPESPVWKVASSSDEFVVRARRASTTRLGIPALGMLRSRSRNGMQSVRPGVEPTTYRIEGSSAEHENPDPSATPAKRGKPPSPAMSRTGGRAFVVVGGRESRPQGEGRQ